MLAGEIGVTKQAIFQKMKKEPLASGLNNLTTKVGGIVYVYPEGEGMIKEQFHKMQSVFAISHVGDNINANTLNNNVINVIKQQIDRKDRQLDALNLHISIKNKQIENLHKQIEELSRALVTSQEQTKTAQNLHANNIQRETLEKLTANRKELKKRNLWKKES